MRTTIKPPKPDPDRDPNVAFNMSIPLSKADMIRRASKADGRTVKGFVCYHLTRVVRKLGLEA